MNNLSSNNLKNELTVILLTSVVCRSAERYSDPNDEKRPYEFGFTIDGEQHRYEKKDEKGIIMGEFGFITADGIYHVTVYATDENGDFKIISIKNIKVGFPPGKTTTTTAKPYPKPNLQLNGFRGCSGCLIPETSQPMVPIGYSPGNMPFVKTVSSDDLDANVDKKTQSSFLSTTPKNRFDTSGYSKTVQSTSKSSQEYGNLPLKKYTAMPVLSTSLPHSIPDKVYSKPLFDKMHISSNTQRSQDAIKPVPDELTRNIISNPIENTPPNAKFQPQLNEMEMKILDYMAKLYKFNYTLSFHGHEETGDVDGNKNGSYFSNGRDGYQRKVIYIANEFGYQPKISLVKLNDEFIPKEQTEKELTKLKGIEFIWFYSKK